MRSSITLWNMQGNEAVIKERLIQRRSRWKWHNPYISKLNEKPLYIAQLPEGDRLAQVALKDKIAERLLNKKQLYLELGSGSGAHLVELASQNPDCLCIGVELRFKRVFKTAEKAERAGLDNLLVIHSNARRISEFLNPSSCQRVYVNFPDPWEKRGWEKHRLLNKDFLVQIAEILVEGGKFRYKTDHQKNFQQVVDIATLIPLLRLSKLSYDLTNSEYASDSIKTEFENLFLSQGLSLCFVEFCRNSVSSL